MIFPMVIFILVYSLFFSFEFLLFLIINNYMKSERSKSALKPGGKSSKACPLQARVLSFIKRQKSKENQESPNFKGNKSSEALTERSETIIKDELIDMSSDTIKTSKSSLNDIKKFQDMLRSHLNLKPSYTNSMILRKVNQKSEEVQTFIKILDVKSKKLGNLEKSLHEKLENLKEKELILKSDSSINIQEKVALYDTFNSFEDVDVRKKISFDELFNQDYKGEEIQTPGFSKQQNSFKNQLEMSQLESELRLKSQELSKIAEELKKKEKKVANNVENLNNRQKEIISKEKWIKTTKENLENQQKELDFKIKTNFCKNIVHGIIDRSIDEVFSYEKEKINLFHEKIQKDFEEISNYETRVLDDYSKKKRELEKKTQKLLDEENRVLRQVKLLSKDKFDKILQEKIQNIEKREIKLRSKQLELLEFKESLKDKEEELVEKGLIFNQNSSIYKENNLQAREIEINKRKIELERFKDTLLNEWNSSRSYEEVKDDKIRKKEQELVEIWKILQEKEQILADKANEMQELAGIMANKLSSNQYSVLDKLLYDSVR